ncbi:MAG: carbohydrate binding family 9 domain-containing protein, partial [Bacteroidales bacterium]|nr:carbohydrate binding family 9 domain-containing protein [Bacteroidales bacterium]
MGTTFEKQLYKPYASWNLILLTSLLTMLYYSGVIADNPPQKTVLALLIDEEVKIDGKLDESAWQKAVPGDNFVQYDPVNGEKPIFDTEIRILYDNHALYLGALMFDPHPDSIPTGLGERDDWSMAADFFAITLDPYNTGLSGYEFWISSSGIQVDKYVAIGESNGFNWNAVWETDVEKTENGWVAEIRIPYSALRFPVKEIQEWGAIFWRYNSRYSEWSTWKHIDPEINGTLKQAGKIEGLKNIEPPVRLAFYPYVSTYAERNTANHWGYSWTGGMDIKYGLNESFTLDMTLVPDFGQVQSDEQELNLTPYEIQYDEKRQFFTEGMDLFNRGRIFYSRRIGGIPSGYYDVEDQLQENEKTVINPGESRMINATKLSGRTNSKLGIGFLNAMTSETKAVILDTLSGQSRDYVTQPFTNYNVIVFDQGLKNNSYISFINTNVSMPHAKLSANVTGTEFRLVEKSNHYALDGRFNISQKYNSKSHPVTGNEYFIRASKVSGKYRFGAYRIVRTHHYDPNDLGYLQRNNENFNAAYVSYYSFKPVWIFMNWFTTVELQHSSLCSPSRFSQFNIDLMSNATLKNRTEVGFFARFFPDEKHDYYEAREEGRQFIKPATAHLNVWMVPDYKKVFGVATTVAASSSYNYTLRQRNYYFEINPRYRPNDKLRLGYSFANFYRARDIGYVDNISDYIIF